MTHLVKARGTANFNNQDGANHCIKLSYILKAIVKKV